jgi:hypothetical protein
VSRLEHLAFQIVQRENAKKVTVRAETKLMSVWQPGVPMTMSCRAVMLGFLRFRRRSPVD